MTQDRNLSDKLQKHLDDLQGLRDEVRLKIHLAAADARDAWKDLEGKVNVIEQRIEREGRDASTAAVELVTDLKRAVLEFRDRLNS